MAVLTVLMRPLNLVATVVLARLLEPADFGLIALAMVLLSTSYLIVGLGMGAALVHSRHEIAQIAFPAFAVTLAAGLFFFLLVQVNLDSIGFLLGTNEVIPVVQWLSAIILLNALNIIPQSILRRELMFRQIATGIVIQQFAYLMVAVGLAYSGFGLWSLVYGQLFSQFAGTVWVWWSCPGWGWIIPHKIQWGLIHSLVSYGMKTFGSSATSYFHSHWDDWLVGRMLGDVALGFYSKSYQFSNDALGKIAKNTVGTVFFATYVRMRDDEARLRSAYLKSIRIVLVLMVPVAFGLAILAPQLVALIFGSKWTPMAPTLQIFALVILSRPLSENSAPFFQAVGHPEYNMRAGILLLAVMIPLALILLPWGIEGVALAVTLSHFWGAAYNVYQSETLMKGIVRPVLISCGQSYFIGLVMALGVHVANILVITPSELNNTIIGLFYSVTTGAIVYILGLYLIQRELFFELLLLVGEQIKPVRQWMPTRLLQYLAVSKAT